MLPVSRTTLRPYSGNGGRGGPFSNSGGHGKRSAPTCSGGRSAGGRAVTRPVNGDAIASLAPSEVTVITAPFSGRAAQPIV